eukprot:TRINITY_DN9480_c0_g1_i1.p1 TRINITY_DN9480_c0_g1~~TRINITY_DN9480_c0_g1_i1.p1  ORF type:complete len:137 (-),score=11.98 TRINITY_DN9480_c0_g1_i1:141-551(-)
MAKKGVDSMEAPEMAKILNPILVLEQSSTFVDCRKIADPEGVKYKKLNEEVKAASKGIKESLRQIIACFKYILAKHKTIAKAFSEAEFISYNSHLLEIRARIDSQLIARSEVRESKANTLLKNLNLTKDAETKVKK